ncbi:hypothetical protein KBX53_24110 [Micromonospora sp. M51]|uniref:hypothetical protein n=1 Tax=Micromonospora sp. M51 TaxID=2824889 RepID=UPI001B37D9E6|nr:hypothetical protein [Micromonospora sp. M51]MBQ1013973.1 hypothetical protein [Micromonospora sp. M51]
MDLDDIAARLGVPVEEVDRAHRPAGTSPVGVRWRDGSGAAGAGRERRAWRG